MPNDVRLQKRRWVYDGLARPPALALVAPGRRVAAARRPSRILLAGGEVAAFIGPPLSRLSQDAGIQLIIQIRRGQPAQAWLDNDWYRLSLERFRPQLVLLAFTRDQDVSALEQMGLMTPVPALWLAAVMPEQPPEGTEPVHLPRSPDTMAPTAAGYAAWAAEAYEAIQRSYDG